LSEELDLSPPASRRPLPALWPYVEIARIDHWFKNAFMLLGVLLAVFYEPTLFVWSSLPPLVLAVLSTCLVASSNYVLNEVLDAPYDRLHPTKRHRPMPGGKASASVALVEWAVLGVAGVGLGCLVHRAFAATAFLFWVAGIVYNVRPLRTKELPYLDVLSESVNNPLRLGLGWFALLPAKVPPLSLVIAYWMAGAFFMATKRFAEHRSIRDRSTLAAYRRSFAYYTEDRLLVSMFFYGLTCAFFSGIFIVRYHVELILFVPVAAGFLAYYLKLGLEEDSATQNPERLLRDRKFVLYAVASTILLVLLMFTRVPILYDLFNIASSPVDPLWTIGPDGE
jgi:4-hydroxybenzoate polyprenyltransferase